LNYLNDNTKKIITIEDPVEYKIDGIVQININTELEFDYHTVLKNVLRQDPDVLMIGEIRDTLSLKIAIRAALTGHLVIATVHTNSAIETISRLQDLQAEPYLIATTLKMVIAQRLVRKLCVKCKRYNERTKYYEKVGCHHCNLTGYDGRMIIPEIFNVDSNVSKMIHEKENLQVIMNYCKENGFESLQKNGLDALQQGLTSMEEYVSTITNEI
jgi:general secretion pathway protein E